PKDFLLSTHGRRSLFFKNPRSSVLNSLLELLGVGNAPTPTINVTMRRTTARMMGEFFQSASPRLFSSYRVNRSKSAFASWTGSQIQERFGDQREDSYHCALAWRVRGVMPAMVISR